MIKRTPIILSGKVADTKKNRKFASGLLTKERMMMKNYKLPTILPLFNRILAIGHVAHAVLLMAVVMSTSACFSCYSDDVDEDDDIEPVDWEWEEPSSSTPTSTYTPSATTAPANEPAVSDTPAVPRETEVSSSLSSAYQEGYDKGYEDGEDDATSGNGWQEQFDDACRYKGKARHDYEQGYEEGYEAGYYDQRADDE